MAAPICLRWRCWVAWWIVSNPLLDPRFRQSGSSARSERPVDVRHLVRLRWTSDASLIARAERVDREREVLDQEPEVLSIPEGPEVGISAEQAQVAKPLADCTSEQVKCSVVVTAGQLCWRFGRSW